MNSLATLRRLRRIAHRATKVMNSTYHSPRHNNKNDPLDELIFVMLSQMTTFWSFERVFDRLKTAAPAWGSVRRMPLRKLKALIRDAGLSNQKAPRIKSILKKLERDFGRVTLDPLRSMNTTEAECYLTALPGVKKKTAKCVLMYSFGRSVLPVDTHVLRVSRRLGLTTEGAIGDRAHDALEKLVAPADRYAFHVNAVAHGRAMCLAARPRCPFCPLKTFCEYGKRHCRRPR